MLAPETTNIWNSIHVFLHDSNNYHSFMEEDLNLFLQEMKKNKLIDKWFFIRYWEGGPHIRLRFLNLKVDVQQVIEKLNEIITKYSIKKQTDKLTAEDYYKNHKFNGKKINYTSLPFYPNFTVKEISYEPEILRYGGDDAIHVCENLFYHSSEISLNLISKKIPFNKLLVVAIDIMIITALELKVKNLGVFFDIYARFWNNYVDDREKVNNIVNNLYKYQGSVIQKRLELLENIDCTYNQGNLNSLYVEWKKHVQTAYRNLLDCKLINPLDGKRVDDLSARTMAIQTIAISIIHMTNNRLGITPDFEYILASLIKKLVD